MKKTCGKVSELLKFFPLYINYFSNVEYFYMLLLPPEFERELVLSGKYMELKSEKERIGM